MRKTFIFAVGVLFITLTSYAFTYKNNSQTGKPDLVTTSVNDLTDIGNAYVPYSVFKVYTSTDRLIKGPVNKTIVGTDANGQLVDATSSTLTNPIKGTTTNDSATAGNVGEYVVSTGGPTNFATSGQYGDFTSIALTAGDWDVTGFVVATANSATVTRWLAGISTTSGNSGTGLSYALNLGESPVPTAAYNTNVVIPAYRISIAGNATYYLKMYATYTVAIPQGYYRLSARRVR